MSNNELNYELNRENRSLMLSLHDSEKNAAELRVELNRVSAHEFELTLKFANSEKEISRLAVKLEDAEKEIVRLAILLKS